LPPGPGELHLVQRGDLLVLLPRELTRAEENSAPAERKVALSGFRGHVVELVIVNAFLESAG